MKLMTNFGIQVRTIPDFSAAYEAIAQFCNCNSEEPEVRSPSGGKAKLLVTEWTIRRDSAKIFVNLTPTVSVDESEEYPATLIIQLTSEIELQSLDRPELAVGRELSDNLGDIQVILEDMRYFYRTVIGEVKAVVKDYIVDPMS